MFHKGTEVKHDEHMVKTHSFFSWYLVSPRFNTPAFQKDFTNTLNRLHLCFFVSSCFITFHHFKHLSPVVVLISAIYISIWFHQFSSYFIIFHPHPRLPHRCWLSRQRPGGFRAPRFSGWCVVHSSDLDTTNSANPFWRHPEGILNSLNFTKCRKMWSKITEPVVFRWMQKDWESLSDRPDIALGTELDPAGLTNHERTASLNGLAAGRGNSGSVRFHLKHLETAGDGHSMFRWHWMVHMKFRWIP